MMWDSFKNQTALVTGAGSGIGRSIALRLGEAGAHVGVHYCRNRDGAEKLQGEIERAGGRGTLLQADLSEESGVLAMFEQFDAATGRRLDGLVCNAGEWMDKCPIAECELERWDRIFNVNLRSVFLCCREAVLRMSRQAEGGAIVNIGSVAGHTGGGGGTVPYAAAKAAVHTLTRGLSKEVAGKKIRVNAVAPGMVDTPMLDGRVSDEARRGLEKMTPAGRFAEPADIAEVVLMLLSPISGYMIGQVVDVNGGLLMR